MNYGQNMYPGQAQQHAAQQPNQQGYPGQQQPPQYGAPPAQQIPPQAAQAPHHGQQNPGGYPNQGQGQYGAPQGPQQAQPPTYYMPDDQATQDAYARVPAGFGTGPQFVRVLGPRGETDWSSVPVGYKGHEYIRLLPLKQQGQPLFVESKTQFYKSRKYPKGKMLGFAGEDSLFMRAIGEAARSNDPRLQKIATEFGRVKSQYLYNVVMLGRPESHLQQDNSMRPFILAAGRQLHRDIGQLAEHRGGISRMVDIHNGHPLKLIKTKHGPELMNVEYTIIDDAPQPLDPYFYPCISNAWDLQAQVKPATEEEMLEAIRELNLPMPQTQTHATVPTDVGHNVAYQPNPNPPHNNPYAAQAPGQSQGPAYGQMGQFNAQQGFPPAQSGQAIQGLPAGQAGQYGGGGHGGAGFGGAGAAPGGGFNSAAHVAHNPPVTQNPPPAYGAQQGNPVVEHPPSMHAFAGPPPAQSQGHSGTPPPVYQGQQGQQFAAPPPPAQTPPAVSSGNAPATPYPMQGSDVPF